MAVMSRFWVRIIKRKEFFLDDWVILVALVSLWDQAWDCH